MHQEAMFMQLMDVLLLRNKHTWTCSRAMATPAVACMAQVDAAHLCYLVAGLTPTFWEPGARLCVLGADHAARSCASVPALQRTEVLEWAKLPGERPSSQC